MVMVTELSPQQAQQRMQAGVSVLDVRGEGECALGMAEGVTVAELGALLETPQRYLPALDEEVGLICASGMRTRAAVHALRAQGYTHLWSVVGGTERWRQEGLPMTAAQESVEFLQRYSRHLLLPEIGLQGQRKLRDAKVALIGAGGLGSPIALYLAAAGVGTLTLIDDDVVDRSNLQRQVVHGEADVGRAKVASAKARLLALNPELHVLCHQTRLRANNVATLLGGHDVVVDGTDNFSTRYLVNEACVRMNLPLVYGAVERFRGQVSVFWPGQSGGCYRCVFPEPPPAELAPNCAEAGVLGVLPGLVGMLQATEVLKLLLQIGQPLLGTLLCVDALSMHFDRIPLGRDMACATCAPQADRQPYADLTAVCAGIS